MFGFFVMGFVDIVGITTSYVKNDFRQIRIMTGPFRMKSSRKQSTNTYRAMRC